MYAQVVKKKLEKLGYSVFHEMLNASIFGVPQPRPRFIMVAVRKKEEIAEASPFQILKGILPDYRRGKGLHSENNTTVREAISDLETEGAVIVDSHDTEGFRAN